MSQYKRFCNFKTCHFSIKPPTIHIIKMADNTLVDVDYTCELDNADDNLTTRASFVDSTWTPSSPYRWSPSSPERPETSKSSKKGKAKNRRRTQHQSVNTTNNREKESLKRLGTKLRKLTTKYIEKSVQTYFFEERNKKAKSAITLIVSRLKQAEDMSAVIDKHLKL